MAQTEPQWSSGPWTLEPNGGDDTDPREKFICAPNPAGVGGTSMIAEVDTDPCTGDWRANARVMKAGPALFKSLRNIITLFESDLKRSAPAQLEAARAALSEATDTA